MRAIWIVPIVLWVWMGSCVLPVDAAQRVQIFERDAESWAGHRYGEILELHAQATLTARRGQRQRINPMVKSDRYLSNIGLWLGIPAALSVADDQPLWLLQSRTPKGASYAVRISQINAGEQINAREAIYVTPSDLGRFEISYIVTARELRAPIHGHFTIQVQE